MINTNDKKHCCGCSGCAQACPKSCISMQADSEGFKYPLIDNEKCVNCGTCERVCPVASNSLTVCDKESVPKVYAIKHNNEVIRKESSSGGAFSLLAEYVIAKGGLVYACRLDENMKAIHTCVDRLDDLHAFRGSKYVQSEIGTVYRSIKRDLEERKKVLFVGTPCQAAGLYAFMGYNSNDNLIIVDFICHGVPSPQIFSDFIQFEEEKHGSKVIEHAFRNKDKGWNQSGLQLGSRTRFDNGTVIRRYPAFKDKYMNAFLDDVCLRPSCYECHFKKIPKLYSDFTIADFWGIDKVVPEMNDNKGTSLVLVNTQNGQMIFDTVKSNCDYKEVEYDKAVKRNNPLVKSAKEPARRRSFFEDYDTKGYSYVQRKYMSAFLWALHKSINLGFTMLSRFEQFIKFAIVGASNTIINLSVYYLCIYLGAHYLLAYTAGFIVSVCNAFFWNNRYVFKNKQEKNLVKAFIKVLTSYGFSFVLSVILMSIMVELIGIPSVVAPLLKMVITIPINFVLNKVWAFKDTNR